MYDNDKPIKIYTWKSTKLNQPDPKIQLKSMNNMVDKMDYDPLTNARQLAKLFTSSLPGNTLDIFYESIAECLNHLLDPNMGHVNQQHVENTIRIAINQLAEGEVINDNS